jgi:hypothetical protein
MSFIFKNPTAIEIARGQKADRQSSDIQFPCAVRSVQLGILMIDVIFTTVRFQKKKKKQKKQKRTTQCLTA